MALDVVKSALSYVTPSPITSLMTVKNLYAKAHVFNSKDQRVYSELDGRETGRYNQAKTALIHFAVAAVAAVVFYKFGNKLGDNYNKVAALTAVVISGSLKHGALMCAIIFPGKDAVLAFKVRDYANVAKNAGFVLAALFASSNEVRKMVYASFIESRLITKS